MIASLSGMIQSAANDHVVLDVNGIGYLVYVPEPVASRFTVGKPAFLYTHLVVREESLTLVGFDTPETREYFLLLLSVNGIGLRSALAILSGLSPDTIRRAVFHQQAEVFSQIPGVGKKTAQKILITLQDRIKAEADLEPVKSFSETDSEVLSALTSLGYSVVEAQAAVQSIPAGVPEELEERIRAALGYFVTPKS